ncbi:MAG: hypothetical protein ABSB81_06135 [Halobacteriota archaeon]|jgi:hypothetical protein
MSEQCVVLGGPVQPLNCHGCATKECEFRERQLERVFTRALISAKEERVVDASAAFALVSL